MAKDGPWRSGHIRTPTAATAVARWRPRRRIRTASASTRCRRWRRSYWWCLRAERMGRVAITTQGPELRDGHGGRGRVRELRARARRGSGRGSVERVLGHPLCGRRGAGQLSTKVESRVLHGGHVLATRRTLKHFDEQVAGNRVTNVGDQFWPFPCRIRRWAKYKVCQTRAALHFSFNCHCH